MALRPNHEQLLTQLAANSLVKAALLMDIHGQVMGSRGSTNLIKTGSPSIRVSPELTGGQSQNKENVFLLEIDEGILVVVFQEGVDFERLRKLTTTVLEQLSIPVMS